MCVWLCVRVGLKMWLVCAAVQVFNESVLIIAAVYVTHAVCVCVVGG